MKITRNAHISTHSVSIAALLLDAGGNAGVAGALVGRTNSVTAAPVNDANKRLPERFKTTPPSELEIKCSGAPNAARRGGWCPSSDGFAEVYGQRQREQ
jgi:hypothetical protein